MPTEPTDFVYLVSSIYFGEYPPTSGVSHYAPPQLTLTVKYPVEPIIIYRTGEYVFCVPYLQDKTSIGLILRVLFLTLPNFLPTLVFNFTKI